MFRRMTIAPFEMAIAIFLVISGVSGLFHYGVIDPLAILIPMWEEIALNCLAIISGLCMLFGVAIDSGRFEAAGLFFLNGALISRFILYGHYLGYGNNFIQTGIFDLVVVIASLIRGRTIRKKHVIVKFDNISSVESLSDVSS